MGGYYITCNNRIWKKENTLWRIVTPTGKEDETARPNPIAFDAYYYACGKEWITDYILQDLFRDMRAVQMEFLSDIQQRGTTRILDEYSDSQEDFTTLTTISEEDEFHRSPAKQHVLKRL